MLRSAAAETPRWGAANAGEARLRGYTPGLCSPAHTGARRRALPWHWNGLVFA